MEYVEASAIVRSKGGVYYISIPKAKADELGIEPGKIVGVKIAVMQAPQGF